MYTPPAMPHVVVIGGGIAGLAAAWKCVREAGSRGGAEDPLRVTLLEAAPRLGGKIVTEHTDGFLIEGGADSFAARKPRGVGLVRELGLEERLIPTGTGSGPAASSNRAPGGVYLALGDRLVGLPRGLSLVVPTRLGPLLRSPLLSARGKLRVGLDLVLPRGGASARREEPAPGDRIDRHGDRPPRDESVADLVRRRFGAEYLERVAGPLLGGIHSTDPEELSIESAFPHLSALERRHRSLLLGVRRGNGTRPAWGPRAERDTAAARVSLKGGMGELVDALVEHLREAGVDLQTGRAVAGLETGSASNPGAPWTVHPDGGAPLRADAVILATPSPVTGDLVRPLDSTFTDALAGIPQISTATVSLGLPASAFGEALAGMGFLVPRSEGRQVSACTFSSLKFPGRAPDGSVLLRAFVGGAGNWEPASDAAVDVEGQDDHTLVETVRRELAPLLGLDANAEPVAARVHRFVAANPQYRVGHAERVRALEERLPPGLALAGCAYHGLGIPDCIASGERAAAAVLTARPAG